jgi:hypothetical protein
VAAAELGIVGDRTPVAIPLMKYRHHPGIRSQLKRLLAMPPPRPLPSLCCLFDRIQPSDGVWEGPLAIGKPRYPIRVNRLPASPCLHTLHMVLFAYKAMSMTHTHMSCAHLFAVTGEFRTRVRTKSIIGNLPTKCS